MVSDSIVAIFDLMIQDYFEGQKYLKEDYSSQPLPGTEFDSCTFTDCSFAGADLIGARFMECQFSGCDLSNAVLKGVSFADVSFSECKMLGLRFDLCNQLGFTVSFEKCMLNHSVFFQVKLMNTTFSESSLIGVDFNEADLKKASFENCDLADATFENCNLEKADFTNAVNYSLDPENNRIKGASFSLPAVCGLLNKYDIKIEAG